MSRMMIFDLGGNMVGEIHAPCTRAWVINDAVETTVVLPDESVLDCLDFGRLVYIEHEYLPAWAGVIDTPWSAVLPVKMSVYSCEYLLHMRMPDAPLRLEGSTGAIAKALLSAANAQETLPILAGDIDEDSGRVEQFDQRTIWEQLKDLVARAGMEMRFRPAMENGRLVIYLDIKRTLGIDTGFLLHDGAGANVEISDAVIDGEIINRIIGIGDQQSKESRTVTPPVEDEESEKRYRLRSAAMQFGGDISLSQMLANVKVALANTSMPVLTLTAKALDIGDTFRYLDLGNSLVVHASQLYLPGGVRGWRGFMRIYAMAYNEATNQVEMTLEAQL